jgi:hypothetical protein
MNHTIVVTDRERDERFENMLNQRFRRCRIVNVKRKTPPVNMVGGLNDLLRKQLVIPAYPFKNTEWAQTYMDKCGCAVGSNCGNAACPHRSGAICQGNAIGERYASTFGGYHT